MKKYKPEPKKRLTEKQAKAVLNAASGDEPKLRVDRVQRNDSRLEIDLVNEEGGRYAVSARNTGASIIADRVVTPSGSIWEGPLFLGSGAMKGLRSLGLASQSTEVTVEKFYRVMVGGRRAGMCHMNGRGKKGLSFPDGLNTNIFDNWEEAEEVAKKLRAYLADLAAAPKKKTKKRK